MYKKIEPALRMTRNEASAHYPDEFIIMQMDSMDLSDDIGTVLYVGDNQRELYALVVRLNLPFSGVVDGFNYYRNDLGGVIVSG
jgi:hypothetical protein